MPADPDSSSQCQLKAAITFDVDGRPQRDPTLTIGPDVDGIPFDPDPAYDLDPTGFPDSDLSRTSFLTELNVLSLLSIKETRRRRVITNAAEARTSVARVREMQRRFRPQHPQHPQLSSDLLMRVARSARGIADLDKQMTRITFIEASIAVLVCLAAAIWLGITGSETIFGSWWPSWTVVVAVIWVLKLLADAPYRPHMVRTILFITLSILFAYVLLVSTIARVSLPTTTPEFVKWLALFGGQVASLWLLGRLVIAIAIPIRKLQWRRCLGKDAGEDDLFHQFLYCAFLVMNDETPAFCVSALDTAAEIARGLHNRQDQEYLDPQVREELRKRGEKVAATIRYHSYLHAMPGFSRDAIARSLFNGAMSIYQSKWDNLCQIEPSPTAKSAVRRYAPRVITAAVLAAAAIVLPTLPGLLPPDQANYIRATLLVAAVFALIVSDNSKLRETAMNLTKDAFGKSSDK